MEFENDTSQPRITSFFTKRRGNGDDGPPIKKRKLGPEELENLIFPNKTEIDHEKTVVDLVDDIVDSDEEIPARPSPSVPTEPRSTTVALSTKPVESPTDIKQHSNITVTNISDSPEKATPDSSRSSESATVRTSKPSKPALKRDRSQSLVVAEHTNDRGQTIQIRMGDITQEDGPIVNAANSMLAHGGGVAGAIRRVGGREIQRESTEWVKRNGSVREGSAAWTSGGDLMAPIVIHAVGPIYRGGEHREDENLHSCVWERFGTPFTDLLGLIPISSGIFGFPKTRCAKILTGAALDFFETFPTSPLKEIRFTNFDTPTVNIFHREFRNIIGKLKS